MHYYDSSEYNESLGQEKALARDPNPVAGPITDEMRGFVLPGFGARLIQNLPPDSFALEVKFKLITPYVSKDDVDPEEKNSSIVKDRVYQLPMVRPTTWKGRLRFSSKQQGEDDELVNHLFGLSSDLEDNQEGRLHFYPTFFPPTMDGSETINPHSRSTRRGRLLGPVELKCVKAETEGKFFLLYLGPALPGTSRDSIIASVLSWVRKMIEFHGIGGKTLKGFGLGVISETWLSTDRDRCEIALDAEGGPN